MSSNTNSSSPTDAVGSSSSPGTAGVSSHFVSYRTLVGRDSLAPGAASRSSTPLTLSTRGSSSPEAARRPSIRGSSSKTSHAGRYLSTFAGGSSLLGAVCRSSPARSGGLTHSTGGSSFPGATRRPSISSSFSTGTSGKAPPASGSSSSGRKASPSGRYLTASAGGSSTSGAVCESSPARSGLKPPERGLTLLGGRGISPPGGRGITPPGGCGITPRGLTLESSRAGPSRVKIPGNLQILQEFAGHKEEYDRISGAIGAIDEEINALKKALEEKQHQSERMKRERREVKADMKEVFEEIITKSSIKVLTLDDARALVHIKNKIGHWNVKVSILLSKNEDKVKDALAYADLV